MSDTPSDDEDVVRIPILSYIDIDGSAPTPDPRRPVGDEGPWDQLMRQAYDQQIEYLLRDHAAFQKAFRSTVPATPPTFRQRVLELLRNWRDDVRYRIAYAIYPASYQDDEW